MECSITFRDYYGRFFRKLVNEATPWARDNIVFAVIMVLSPSIAVYSIDHNHPIDWQVAWTTIWIYLFAFGIYLSYYLVRTAWKLDTERAQDLKSARDAGAAIQMQVAALTRKPDLRGDVLSLSESIMDFIHERLINAPSLPYATLNYSDHASALQQIMEHGRQKAKSEHYKSETFEIYDYRFKRRVISMVKTLESMNLRKETPEGFWSSPESSDSIKIIGKTLAELADQIPQPSND